MLHEQFELQNAANTMENESFELKIVANTVEMAASSSKMLQIGWKMDRPGNQKNNLYKRKKNQDNAGPKSKSLHRSICFGDDYMTV